MKHIGDYFTNWWVGGTQNPVSIIYSIYRLTTANTDNHRYNSQNIWENSDGIFHKKQTTLEQK